MMVFIAVWIAVSVAGIAALRNTALVARGLFPIGAALGLGVAVLAVVAIRGAPQTAVLAIGMPPLPAPLRLDALSACFLAVIG